LNGVQKGFAKLGDGFAGVVFDIAVIAETGEFGVDGKLSQ
jgi:hypothetical protein